MTNGMGLRRRVAVLAIVPLLLIIGAAIGAWGVLYRAQAPQPEIALGSGGTTPSRSEPVPGRPEAPPSWTLYTYRRASDPARTEMSSLDGKPVAVMTDDARTVHLYGPERTFAERRFTRVTVTTDIYVRLAPQAWHQGAEREGWFTAWLPVALADRSPDVLAIAMQYTYDTPPSKDASGRQIGGDAAFGPLSDIDPDGRAENSDFYDYLGIPWKFPDMAEVKPSRTHFQSLDCSGFLRMVYGYRMGYPTRGTNNPGPGLPRQAFAIANIGPGVQLMPNTGRRARGLDRLLPGDMVFFNAGQVATTNIEHSGIYLGVDSRGHHRFISSRSQANGPTMGDLGGDSLLDGTGYWASRWRTARRI